MYLANSPNSGLLALLHCFQKVCLILFHLPLINASFTHTHPQYRIFAATTTSKPNSWFGLVLTHIYSNCLFGEKKPLRELYTFRDFLHVEALLSTKGRGRGGEEQGRKAFNKIRISYLAITARRSVFRVLTKITLD